MLLIAVYYRRCGRNLRAKLYTAINSLSANHAYLKTLYYTDKFIKVIEACESATIYLYTVVLSLNFRH